MYTTYMFKDVENKTDEELVKLTLENQNYFAEIIQRYEQKLLNYIRRISNLGEEAEDVLQEVFIKVYQNLNGFDPKLKFSSWIYRITHNQVISNYRKNKARPHGLLLEMEEGSLENIADEFNFIEKIEQKKLRENIIKVLDKMDLKYKEVLVLKFLEEKDYKEISDILKKPMGTVASMINRAKKQFQEELDKSNIKL
ncbi:MAG: sigma-70 family RNA polymerase sigma factor [bacterium]